MKGQIDPKDYEWLYSDLEDNQEIIKVMDRVYDQKQGKIGAWVMAPFTYLKFKEQLMPNSRCLGDVSDIQVHGVKVSMLVNPSFVDEGKLLYGIGPRVHVDTHP